MTEKRDGLGLLNMIFELKKIMEELIFQTWRM